VSTDEPRDGDDPAPSDPGDAGPTLGEPSDPPPSDPSPSDPPPSDQPPSSSTGCDTASPDAGEWTLIHDGETRRFHVRLPPGFNNTSPTPVVVSFHGRAVNASSQELTSGFTPLAAAEGFIAVYPEGLGALQTWSAGVCCGNGAGGADDVGFFGALLDRLNADLCVDTTRVYANGLSAGAFMSYGVACEHSDKLAAVAAVAGATGLLDCDPDRPLPVLHFHGTADTIVPYDGNYGFSFLAAENNAAAWAERNGCGAAPSVVLEAGDVTCEAWSGCDDDADVRLCTIEGGGHQWPGGVTAPGFGHNTNAIDATQMMWEFFSAHTR
jgi:polyhydroxybutyrate depolymerase